MDVIKLPEGRYYYQNGTHSIMFYLPSRDDFPGKNFSLSCDSFEGLIVLVYWFFSPSYKFETLSQYNASVLSSQEDTVEIMIPDWEEKKAA